ncbi:MAG TPA: branched-chain amino acid transaminase [Terriglobales bacterium]|nr:branched-chain amino acid transaminase [Terriglobales bacterium]
MGFQSQYVWMNGKLVNFQEATLHFLSAGLHYGIGVFEGIRCYSADQGPAVFRLDDHMRRLMHSAAVLGWRDLPFSLEQLTEGVHAVVAANGFTDCYIRPLIYLAEGGWNLNIDGGKPHVGIAAWKWDSYLGKEALDRGVRANTSSFTRHHVNASMSKAKICGNYVNSVLAKSESVRLGFDEAILLDTQGYVAECTGENLFLVRGKTLITAPGAEVLEGITRETVIALARDLGYTIAEQLISRDQLYIADEVLVCGTAAEVIGLREIDFRKIGSGISGPVTRRLQQAFWEVVRGRHLRSKEWLTYVPAVQASGQLPLVGQDSATRPGTA